jgi:hypothetical protein
LSLYQEDCARSLLQIWTGLPPASRRNVIEHIVTDDEKLRAALDKANRAD